MTDTGRVPRQPIQRLTTPEERVAAARARVAGDRLRGVITDPRIVALANTGRRRTT